MQLYDGELEVDLVILSDLEFVKLGEQAEGFFDAVCNLGALTLGNLHIELGALYHFPKGNHIRAERLYTLTELTIKLV